jgi:hypothetical protein
MGGVDFSAHTREGFLFTPNAYTGPYESLGMVYVTMHAEGNLEEVDRRTGMKAWVFKEISVQDALTETRRRAVAMGANALANFNVHSSPKLIGSLTIPGIEVSGFAIKRLDK